MANLPDYVKFLGDGYTEPLDYNVRRSEMDSGLGKQRPGRSKPVRTRKGTLTIGSPQNRVDFEKWLKDNGGGTRYFDFKDPLTGVTKKCRFVNKIWDFQWRYNTWWEVPCELESIG